MGWTAVAATAVCAATLRTPHLVVSVSVVDAENDLAFLIRSLFEKSGCWCGPGTGREGCSGAVLCDGLLWLQVEGFARRAGLCPAGVKAVWWPVVRGG